MSGGKVSAAPCTNRGWRTMPTVSCRRTPGAISGASTKKTKGGSRARSWRPCWQRTSPPWSVPTIFLHWPSGAGRKRKACEFPEDLSITGMDNLPAAALRGLTSVAQPFEKIGQAAVNAIIGLLEGAGAADVSRVLPVELIMRASVAPPRCRQTMNEKVHALTNTSRSACPCSGFRQPPRADSRVTGRLQRFEIAGPLRGVRAARSYCLRAIGESKLYRGPCGGEQTDSRACQAVPWRLEPAV